MSDNTFYLHYFHDSLWDGGHEHSNLSNDVAKLLIALNYRVHYEDWIAHLASSPDCGGVASLKHPRAKDASDLFFFESVLLARGVDATKITSAVATLCDAGVDITETHILMFFEYVTLGAIGIGSRVKPSLYAVLFGQRAEEAAEGTDDDDEEEEDDGNSGSRRESDSSEENAVRFRARRDALKRKAARVRKGHADDDDDDDVDRVRPTMTDLLSSLGSLLGMICLVVGLKLMRDTSRFSADWLHMIAASGSVLGDVQNSAEHRALVRDIIQKLRCIHAMTDGDVRVPLFTRSARFTTRGNKSRFSDLVSGELDVGIVPLSANVPPLPDPKGDASSSPSEAAVYDDLSFMLYCADIGNRLLHPSTVVTAVMAAAFPGPLDRDLRLHRGGRDGGKFTLSARVRRDDGEESDAVSSATVDKWLLMARFPWFRSLVMSGLEESRTSTLTFPEPMHLHALLFIATTVYSHHTPDTEANEYWKEGMEACMSAGMIPAPDAKRRPTKRTIVKSLLAEAALWDD